MRQSWAGLNNRPKHSTRPFVRIAQSFVTLVYFPGRAALNDLHRSSPLVITPQATETFLKGPGSMFVAESDGSSKLAPQQTIAESLRSAQASWLLRATLLKVPDGGLWTP